MKEVLIRAIALLALCIANTGCDAVADEIKLHKVFSDPDVIALVHASESCNADKIRKLTHGGTNINAHGSHGMTPLTFVMSIYDYKAIECLLKAGADPNQKNDDGNSSVWLAAGNADSKLLALVLDYRGDPNLPGGSHGVTSPLQNAIMNQQFKNMDLLLDHAADINYVYPINNSAATLAAAIGRMDMVVYLLERGYSHNLYHLAIGVDSRIVSADMQPLQEKVLKMLEARGVQFPLPPNPALSKNKMKEEQQR